MRIRWAPGAAADLEDIVDHIRRDNPVAAQGVGRSIYHRLSVLGTFPYSGRLGRIEGTRELPLPPLPIIVVYRVLEHSTWWKWST
jgi:toxin ParE1/3/4